MTRAEDREAGDNVIDEEEVAVQDEGSSPTKMESGVGF